MPYSDVLPPFVLPDDRQAHDEVTRDPTYAQFFVKFCTDFRPGPKGPGFPDIWHERCAHRDLRGDRDHNWCMRCPAGFPFLTTEQTTAVYGTDEFNRRPVPLNITL